MYSDNDFILGMQSGFLEAAEWADGEAISETAFDGKYQPGNGFSENAEASADEFVRGFYEGNKDLLIESGMRPEQCGHDLWLTMQGHGSGFWDRGLGETGEKLTKACESFSCNLYANIDGLLEIEGI